MTPGSVIVASVGSGAQLPHTDVATHPEVPPPDDKDVSECHLSSFLCLIEDYQVAVQAGTALGEAGEARWDTIQLHRGDMLLMVATSRHHGLLALPDSTNGLRGPFLTCGPRTPGTATTSRTPHTWTPPSPQEALAVAGDLSSWDFPSEDQVLWVGKGAVGRVGLWEGGATKALFADAPEAVPAGPPTCPFQPTFLPRCVPSSNLAVMDIAEQSMLFLVGSVHQTEICKGNNVDAESEILFAMSGVVPPVRPTTLWHLLNTAPRGGLPNV